MKEIMIECNNYFGEPSEERCRLVEKLVEEEIKNDCKLKDIVMKEIQVQDNLIQPVITIRYDAGETQLLTELIDRSLIEIGITAIKMVVSKIASRAVEGALAGGVGGGGTGLAAGKNDNVVAITLIGALVGGLIGSAIEKRVPEYVATKSSGRWLSEKINIAGRRR